MAPPPSVTTPHGEQFNALLNSLLLLCFEISSVVTALLQHVSSLAREYLSSGNPETLRTLVLFAKSVRTLVNQLEPLNAIS
jgi:hypothetical protein